MAEIVASLPGFENVLRERVRDLEAMPAPGPSGLQPATFIQGNPPGRADAKSIMAGQQRDTAIKAPVLAEYAHPHNAGPQKKQYKARGAANSQGPPVEAVETPFAYS